MSPLFSISTGYVLLFAYGIAMIGITVLVQHRTSRRSLHDFLVAGRSVSGWLGAVSIAASWIWAPALFVSVQSAYHQGVAGIFWFLVPNCVALLLYIFLAPRIRMLFPEGYTLPQWMAYRLQSTAVHRIYLFPYFFYQIMAVAVQLFAGGHLVSFLLGIPFLHAMLIMAATVLAYSCLSGLESSLVTDCVQFLLIVAGVVIVVPWTIAAAGGWSAVQMGFGGQSGAYASPFNAQVAFSFGIVTSIGLLSGAISDQQYWQRAFALKRENVVSSFLFGALLFGIVPLGLSSLGFLAANAALDIRLPEGVDVSMIGIATVQHFLPAGAILFFAVMLLSALYSTLDSGLNAAASLWTIDVVQKSTSDRAGVFHARMAMLGMTIIGLCVAVAADAVPGFGLQQLWWVFNTIAACVLVPTVLSLYWDRLDARGVFRGVLIAFLVGIPLFVTSNVLNRPVWIVGSSLFIIAISTGCCLLFPKKR